MYISDKSQGRANLDFAKSIMGGKALPSTLVLAAAINGNASNIVFEAKQDGGNELAIENRLSINDAFVVEKIGFGITKVEAAIGSVTAAQLAATVLRSYPNPSIFDDTNETDGLHAIYNGKLNISFNNDKLVDGVDMRRFYRVPAAQQGLETSGYVNAVAADAVTSIPSDGYSHDTSVFIPASPLITLGGRLNIDWSVELPTTVNLNTDAASSTNYAIFVLRGFKGVGQAGIVG